MNVPGVSIQADIDRKISISVNGVLMFSMLEIRDATDKVHDMFMLANPNRSKLAMRGIAASLVLYALDEV